MKKTVMTIIAVILATMMLASCSIKEHETSASEDSNYDNGIGQEVKVEVEAEEGESTRYQNEAAVDEVSEEMYIYRESGEEYGEFSESPFYNAHNVPLSTFSIDVDTASYANIRRFLNDGDLPYPDAVRVEECINYFDYDYDKPRGNDPYSINVEMAQCPWESENYLLMVGINAKELDKDELPASNIVFLVDVSGSMNSSDKLPLLKNGLKMMVDNLGEDDIISLVTYSGDVSVRLEGVSGADKKKIKREIDKLSSGGSTAGGAAMEMAYDIAAENYIDDGNNRIIMATDGDFNVGISSESKLERFIENKRDEGVFLSILGFGTGNIKDNKMELLADKGNGNYSYIDSAQEANKVLVEEMASTVYTLAKDVKIQVEFNPANVKAYRLIGYDNRRLNDEDFNDDTKDAGEMGLGQSVTVFYEIVPQGAEPDIDPLRYGENEEENEEKAQPTDYEWLYIKTKYKNPDEDTSEENIELAVTEDDITSRPSDNFLFGSSVAEFAMILKDSAYCNGDIDDVIDRAKEGRGYDDSGYRAEFIRLVQIAKNLLD